MSRALTSLFAAPILAACAGPAGAAACEVEVTAFRDGSAYLWEGRDVGPNVIDGTWASLDAGQIPADRHTAMTLTNLYAELNNMVKPGVAPDVTPAVVTALGDAIRCIKDEMRATGYESRSATGGLDAIFGPRSEAAFGVPINLGEPL